MYLLQTVHPLKLGRQRLLEKETSMQAFVEPLIMINYHYNGFQIMMLVLLQVVLMTRKNVVGFEEEGKGMVDENLLHFALNHYVGLNGQFGKVVMSGDS